MTLADSIQDIWIDGHTAYLLGNANLHRINVSDPFAPFVLDRMELDTYYQHIVVHRDHILLISDTITVMPVVMENEEWPAAPIDLFDFAENVSLRGDDLFIANGRGGVRVFNISSPTQPVAFASLSDIGYVEDVAPEASLLYTANGAMGISVLEYTPYSSYLPLLHR